MAVSIELDLLVDAEFYWLGLWPNALLDAIYEQAEDIYKSLAPNPLDPEMLVAERVFRVEGRDYRVLCGVERWRASQEIFRVTRVERAGLARKR